MDSYGTSAGHFISHMDQIIVYFGDGSYRAKRLVQYPIGVSGFAHGTMLMMPKGSKVLSHWHDDREAIFYCVAGSGTFVLDGEHEPIGPGDVMFQPLMAIHGAAASSEEEFHFIDFALFAPNEGATGRGAVRPVSREECFFRAANVPETGTKFGVRRDFAPRGGFLNQAIRWIGEIWVGEGQMLGPSDIDDRAEHISMVLSGTGRLRMLDTVVELRPGSVQYLIAGLAFTLENCGTEPLRLVGVSSLPGRIPEPPYFDALRAQYPALTARSSV